MSKPIAATTSDETIRRALAQADTLALRAVVYQLTGDEGLASIPTVLTPRGLTDVPVIANAADEQDIRARALVLLQEIRDGRRTFLRRPRGRRFTASSTLPPAPTSQTTGSSFTSRRPRSRQCLAGSYGPEGLGPGSAGACSVHHKARMESTHDAWFVCVQPGLYDPCGRINDVLIRTRSGRPSCGDFERTFAGMMMWSCTQTESKPSRSACSTTCSTGIRPSALAARRPCAGPMRPSSTAFERCRWCLHLKHWGSHPRARKRRPTAPGTGRTSPRGPHRPARGCGGGRRVGSCPRRRHRRGCRPGRRVRRRGPGGH